MAMKDSHWGSVGVSETRWKILEGTYFHEWQAGPGKENEWESKHWSSQLSMHGAIMDTWILADKNDIQIFFDNIYSYLLIYKKKY